MHFALHKQSKPYSHIPSGEDLCSFTKKSSRTQGLFFVVVFVCLLFATFVPPHLLSGLLSVTYSIDFVEKNWGFFGRQQHDSDLHFSSVVFEVVALT